MADVEYDFAADVTAAERAIARLEAKTEKLENQLKQTHRTSRRGQQEAIRGFQNWATGLASVGTAYAAIRTTIGSVTAENQRLAQSVSALITQLSEQELKLQIQAGLTPPQLQQQIPTIAAQLRQTPTIDLIGGLQLQTQLVSSGFKQIDIDSGAALQTMLQLQAATNQFGDATKSPKESVKSISQLLKGLGLEESAANIRDIGGQFSGVFSGMDVQFTDLSALANIASGLSAADVSPQQQIAAFSGLVEKLSPEVAATALKQFADLSLAAGTKPKGLRGLKALGISAEDIDLSGETILESFGTFAEAQKRTDPVVFRRAMQDIFGTRAATAVQTGVGSFEKMQQALGLLQGEHFSRSVGAFQQSKFAENTRTRIDTQMLERQVGAAKTWKEIADDISLLSAASAASDVGGVGRAVDLFNLADARVTATFGSSFGVRPDEFGMLNRLMDEIRNQTHIQQELLDLQKQNAAPQPPRNVNRQAHTE